MTTTPLLTSARRAPTATLRRALVGLLGVVLITDVVGGLFDVKAGRSSLGTAWGSHATLAAPLPMMAAQVVLVALVLRGARRVSLGAASLLSLACVVSFASGFFDGQLGRGDLTDAEVAFQIWLISATLALGLCAALNGRARYRSHVSNTLSNCITTV